MGATKLKRNWLCAYMLPVLPRLGGVACDFSSINFSVMVLRADD